MDKKELLKYCFDKQPITLIKNKEELDAIVNYAKSANVRVQAELSNKRGNIQYPILLEFKVSSLLLEKDREKWHSWDIESWEKNIRGQESIRVANEGSDYVRYYYIHSLTIYERLYKENLLEIVGAIKEDSNIPSENIDEVCKYKNHLRNELCN